MQRKLRAKRARAKTRRAAAVFTGVSLVGAALAGAPAGAANGRGAGPAPKPLAKSRTVVGAPTPFALPHLTYHSPGHVIENVRVDIVIWNSWTYANLDTTTLRLWMAALADSQYMDVMNQYSTSNPRQTIGHGVVEGVYTVSGPARGANGFITRDQVNATMADAMRRHVNGLPGPGPNRLYMVFLPQNTPVTHEGGNSRSNFCGYHDTIANPTNDGNNAYIGLLPYEADNGLMCSPSLPEADRLFVVASHEFAEAITDPGAGIGNISWRDDNAGATGEIADICRGLFDSVPYKNSGLHLTVEKLWSNRDGQCISHPLSVK